MICILNSDSTNWRSIPLNFFPIDRKLIKSMPLSSINQGDKIMWQYDNNGSYTVKIGNKYPLNEKAMSDQVNNPFEVGGRLCWRHTLHLKWVFYVACLLRFHNIKSKLLRKVVHRTSWIKCGEAESISHLLFYCKISKVVWKEIQ